MTGKVVQIIDGDTFDLLADGKTVRVRLLAIDCPERMQHFYQQSKDALSELCLNKTVRIEVAYKDRFNRLIAEAFVNRTNINEAMIENGFAWHFIRYSNDPHLAALEQEARRKGVGIWSHPQSIAPWEFRDPNRKQTDLGY